MSELLLSVGEKIKRLREAQKLTQQELSEKTSMSRTRISEIERGNVNMKLSTLENISEALEIHVSDLFQFGDLLENNTIKKKEYLLELHLSQLKERGIDEIEYVSQYTNNFLKTIDEKLQNKKRNP